MTVLEMNTTHRVPITGLVPVSQDFQRPANIHSECFQSDKQASSCLAGRVGFCVPYQQTCEYL